MNILIIGEYSAFAKHLKNGFVQLGHKVTIVQNGDNFKKIRAEEDDVAYSPRFVYLFGKRIPRSYILYARSVNKWIETEVQKKLHDHIDLIFVVNADFLSNNVFFRIGVSLSFINKYKTRGAKLIMSCCGIDPAVRSEWGEYFKMVNKKNHKPFFKDKCFDFLIRKADVIIPTAWDYQRCIRNYCNKYYPHINTIHDAVPLPISIIDNIQFESCKKRKIVIFHGVIRAKEKGTEYFVEALKRLEENYSDKVECVIKGGMPYDEYVTLFSRIDILLDQVYGSGMGINAGIGLMNGKVVLGGNSKESEMVLGCGPCPILNVEPDANQIYNLLESLINSPEKIDHIKQVSREYAVKYLNSIRIAKIYLNSVRD